MSATKKRLTKLERLEKSVKAIIQVICLFKFDINI